jgi:hypothetical protein
MATTTCPLCNGRGQVSHGTACPVCHGTGQASQAEADALSEALYSAAVQGASAQMQQTGRAAAEQWQRSRVQAAVDVREHASAAQAAAGQAALTAAAPVQAATQAAALAVQAQRQAQAALEQIQLMQRPPQPPPPKDWGLPPQQPGGPSMLVPGGTPEPGRYFDNLTVRELDVWGSLNAPASTGVGLFPSGDTTGVTDSANIQAVIDSGRNVVLNPGNTPWYIITVFMSTNAAAQLSVFAYGPSVLVYVVGTGQGFYCHRATGYGAQYGLPAQQVCGRLSGFVLDGTFLTSGGKCLDLGDGWGWQVDLSIVNCTAAGTIGANLINRVFWSEKCRVTLNLMNNLNPVVIDTLGGSALPSHEYCDFEFFIFANASEGQNGVVIRNGAYCHGGSLLGRGNFNTSNSALPVADATGLALATLTITGNDPSPAQQSGMKFMLVDWVFESNQNLTNGPVTVNFGATSNYIESCVGVMAWQDSPWATALNAAGGNFTFTGVISGDTVLAPGNQLIGELLVGPANIHGAGGVTEGDLLTVTNTASAPATVPVEFQGATAGDKLLGLQTSGNADNNLFFDTAGAAHWGSGAAAADVRLQRTGLNTLQVDPNSAATSAELDVAGTFGAITVTGLPATPTGRCLIYYRAGVLYALGPSGTPVALATT